MLVRVPQYSSSSCSYIVDCSALTWIQCINHMNHLVDAVQLTQTAWWQTYNGLIVILLFIKLIFSPDSSATGCTVQYIRATLLLLPAVDHFTTFMVACCNHHRAAFRELRGCSLRGT